jgi:drug/metabolite transporter (DMT)-like permease
MLKNNGFGRGPSAWALATALLLVYGVWGTTYFAIGIALQSMPPFWMNALRFALAGALMVAWALWRGAAWPTAVQWRNAALVGGLMVFGAMALVLLAQANGIGSGLMATVVTTMPMWLALWTRLGGEAVPLTSWLGLGLGVAGAGLLALEGDFSANPWAAAAAFAAPLCWSVGSYASRRLDLPSPAMSAGAQWLAGGAMSAGVAVVLEPWAQMAHATPTAWLAWGYLLVLGTLLTLNAYLWLLQNTTAALAGSYSFVNPAVALAVGVGLGREALTGWVFAALPLIALALVLIVYGQPLQARWRGMARRWSCRNASA